LTQAQPKVMPPLPESFFFILSLSSFSLFPVSMEKEKE
jgi:hypothetical protein